MNPPEQRASTRYAVSLEMEIVRDGETRSARMVNLSLGGAQMEAVLDPPLRVGERINVSFELPELDAPLTAQADVRWVGNGPGNVGIQFVTGFRAKQTWALGRFLEKRPQT